MKRRVGHSVAINRAARNQRRGRRREHIRQRTAQVGGDPWMICAGFNAGVQ